MAAVKKVLDPAANKQTSLMTMKSVNGVSLYCACWCWSLDVFPPGGRHQWWNRLCGTHEGIARWKLVWQRGLIALHSDCTWSKAASATEPLSDQSLPT